MKNTIEFIKCHEEANVPKFWYSGDSGFDLACVEDFGIPPGEVVKVPTGLKISLPNNLLLQICSRSGLASKGIIVANSPGIIDQYEGEICVLLINTLRNVVYFDKGDRIAQGVLLYKATRVEFSEVKNFTFSTDRGSNGFGSTGIGV